MALSDPQSVTVGASVNSVPRIIDNPTSSVYSTADGTVALTVGTTTGKRRRTQVRVDLSKIAADPFVTTINRKLSASAYIVMDAPLTGFTPAELKDLSLSLSTWMTASSSANLVKALGGEH
jgi:hypothetical protein